MIRKNWGHAFLAPLGRDRFYRFEFIVSCHLFYVSEFLSAISLIIRRKNMYRYRQLFSRAGDHGDRLGTNRNSRARF